VVRSEPTGARIVLDGRERGRTGVSGVVAGVGPHVDAGPVGRRVVISLDKSLLRVSNGA
jgi:hypothetical protein